MTPEEIKALSSAEAEQALAALPGVLQEALEEGDIEAATITTMLERSLRIQLTRALVAEADALTASAANLRPEIEAAVEAAQVELTAATAAWEAVKPILDRRNNAANVVDAVGYLLRRYEGSTDAGIANVQTDANRANRLMLSVGGNTDNDVQNLIRLVKGKINSANEGLEAHREELNRLRFALRPATETTSETNDAAPTAQTA